ncbi:MAG: tetratricopeptide repeat protein [Phycisphaerales bacterium]|nr:MAG: tetratricopeptide repeat protein [Phycisphaerales bacterium]
MSVTAVIMGLPTLKGTFVGGDDHRLVLNHVLVNHPSLAHAVELFTIVHRDLYQPIPLLSFQIEFAIADVLGLFDEGLSGGAWFFHLTNILLHAANAVLVWVVIRMLQYREGEQGNHAVATIAALLFAIHPLQVEVVAWVNGRMMLLSTLFALASVAAMEQWLRRSKHRWAFLTVLFALCCAISKIRVALPALLMIPLLAHRRKPTWRYAALWCICVVITGIFAVVNYMATKDAGMFEGADTNLHGPTVIRAFLALAWYFEHFLWPTGLASWYPTPALVQWSDPRTLRALGICAAAVIVIGWSALRSRNAALGYAWFFAAIGSTVLLVQTRNALAADRYMYLPIVGLLWVVGIALAALYKATSRRWALSRTAVAAVSIVSAVVIALIAVSWHTASFYDTPIEKSTRIATLAPTTPHVWERVAWAHYRADRFEEAIEAAEREFAHEDNNARGVAHQVIGISLVKLGKVDGGIESLRRAIEVDPENVTSIYWLASGLYELGRVEEAIPLFEQAVAKAPLKNPWIIRLASILRKHGRSPDAAPLYEQALRNNPFEVPATLGLAELDIEAGTPPALRSAERRILGLLEWTPQHAGAWVNLGVTYHALGQTAEAIRSYARALEFDPDNARAALNLAQIYYSADDVPRAQRLFDLAASVGLETIEEVIAVHDFYVLQQVPHQAVQLWIEFLTRIPDSHEARSFLAWSRALIDDLPQAKSEVSILTRTANGSPLAFATLAFIALAEEHYDIAFARTEELCALADQGADARQRLLRALGAVVQQRPDEAWAFCLAGRLWMADDQLDSARAFIDLCSRQCKGDACARQVQSLGAQLASIENKPQ